MTIYETDIPGVGRKFEVDLVAGGQAVVIIHHDGRREVFSRTDPDADADEVFDLTGVEARQLGSILSGAYFETVDAEALTVPLGEAIIEWLEVPADSPLAGGTLGEANVRAETGVSILAVRREGTTVENPGPDYELAVGDVLVTLGSRAEQQALETLVDPDR